MQETLEMRVRFLGQEDPPEEVMATHSSVLAWRIPWTEEPARLQSRGSQRVGHGLATKQQPPADFMDENSSVVQKCPVPKSLNLLMAESGFEPQGVSTVVSLEFS